MSIAQDVIDPNDGDLYDLINDLWVLIGEPLEEGDAARATPEVEDAAADNAVDNAADNAVDNAAGNAADNAAHANEPALPVGEALEPANPDDNDAADNDAADEDGLHLEINLADFDSSNSMPSWPDITNGDDSNPLLLVQNILPIIIRENSQDPLD